MYYVETTLIRVILTVNSTIIARLQYLIYSRQAESLSQAYFETGMFREHFALSTLKGTRFSLDQIMQLFAASRSEWLRFKVNSLVLTIS